MKRASIFAFLLAVLSFAAPAGLSAQTPNAASVADRYVISARAGGVSHVEGNVSITRVNGTAGALLKRDNVEVGDQVTTGENGRAEVLLNPGSYLRLGANSSFEFGATDLEDLTIKLTSGSAIFEVFAADEFRVSVFTPKGKVALVETGVYRVDVAADGSAVAAVTKGRAEIGEDKSVVLKEGRLGTVAEGQVAISKFDKGKRDDFDKWSRDRSKELTKINSSLRDRSLDSLLARGFRLGMWNLRDSFGLWVFDYYSGRYCFLPYGNYWRSPYGGWYGNGIYPGFVPYTPPARKQGTRSVRTLGNPPSSGIPSDRVKTGTRATRTAPPFTQVNTGTKRGIFDGGLPSTNGSDLFPSRSVRTTSVPVDSGAAVPTGKTSMRRQ